MTIAIDCRMLHASGVGVYLRGCLPWFAQSSNSFLLIGNRAQLVAFASYQNIKIIDCDVKPFSIKELLFFLSETVWRINRADVYYSPFFNVPIGLKIPVYTTIHDIIFPDMPELLSGAGLAIRMWFFRRAYRKSRKIFTVSGFSKSRIEHHLGTEKPIVVTYSAIQQMFLEYRAIARNAKKSDTIVFVGNIKKHKGLDCLLDAFCLAKNEGLPHRLVIVGSRDSFRTFDDAVLRKTESLGDSVFFTGFVSDEALMEHISTAALLVQPSLYEGFCLPPLEAMVLGTHALVSDIPVLREVYADFPVAFFRAGDSGDLKEKMMGMLFGKAPASLVLPDELLSKYTFKKTASRIMLSLLDAAGAENCK